MPNKKSQSKRLPAPEFDRPPAAPAQPPAAKKRQKTLRDGASSAAGSYKADDTPKAFVRLMARADRTAKFRSGLDDGAHAKKRKRTGGAAAAPAEPPKIRPGESMRDFRRRVDLEMPVTWKSGGAGGTAGAAAAAGGKVPLSKDERKRERAVKKQANRVADHKAGEVREEELSDEVVSEDEVDVAWKKGKRKASPDPWAELEKKRPKAAFGETMDAPPKLVKPREVFKVYKGAGVQTGEVPRAAGSMARREGLEKERQDVVEAYRKMRGR